MSNPHAHHYKQENPFLDRAYALQNPNEARALYDEWAASYDKDLSDQDYVYPTHAANTIMANLPKRDGDQAYKVLDAGCGTGLVAIRLTQAAGSRQGNNGEAKSENVEAKFVIDGLDISPGMLEIARKTGLYDALEEADLSKSVARDDGVYDVVACVGTLTTGHVGPELIPELVRVVRQSGVVVATVLDAVWEEKGFKAEVEKLEADGKVQILSSKIVGIVGDQDEGGRIVVLKKL